MYANKGGQAAQSIYKWLHTTIITVIKTVWELAAWVVCGLRPCYMMVHVCFSLSRDFGRYLARYANCLAFTAPRRLLQQPSKYTSHIQTSKI